MARLCSPFLPSRTVMYDESDITSAGAIRAFYSSFFVASHRWLCHCCSSWFGSALVSELNLLFNSIIAIVLLLVLTFSAVPQLMWMFYVSGDTYHSGKSCSKSCFKWYRAIATSQLACRTTSPASINAPNELFHTHKMHATNMNRLHSNKYSFLPCNYNPFNISQKL